jgi:hypothetical protein
MATQAQILANRSNARKSTGPRTAEGKAVVAQNAVKHGLCGREVIISGEDPGQFESYRERMLAELDPVGEVEADLAERIVGLSWRLKRADRLQATAFDSLLARQKHSPMEQYDKVQDADGGSTFGRALVRDFGDGRVIDRLSMYERRIEHSLYRTMAELQRHRILQEVGPGQMWELRRTLASDDAGTENHGRDTRATTPPAGGSANAREGVRGDDSSLQTSNIKLPTSPDPSCKTKPISSGPNQGQVPAGEGVMENPPADGAAKTNPISAAREDTLKLRVSVAPGEPATTPAQSRRAPQGSGQPESACMRSARGYNLLVRNRVGFGVSSQG